MGSIVISHHPPALIFGSVYDSDHPLGSGMDVEVLNLDPLRVPSSMPVEGLDHFELKPKELDGIIAVYADIDLVEVMLALA